MSYLMSMVEKTHSTARRDIATYIGLTLAIAWSCQAAALWLGVDFNQIDSSSPMIWFLLIGSAWAPGLSALMTSTIYRHSLREMGWGLGRPRYLLWGALLPLIFISTAYAIAWLLNPVAFAPLQVKAEAVEMLGSGEASGGFVVFIYLLLTTLMLILPIGFFALGEDLGWGGWLIPHLAHNTSFANTALITGLVWALYHYPLMLFGDYTQGTSLWFGLAMNTLVLIALAFTQTWLRLSSGTIWPVVLAHTLWNILMFYVFEPITHATSLTLYLVGEKGAITALIVTAFALLLWQLSRNAETTP